ncbi:hypothetical protein J6590_067453 [Homalodisca vitripennis]|nr:hypothetical protein J6590_067453 [Homalodisca vitripennis]
MRLTNEMSEQKPRETKTDEGLSLALGLRLLCDLSTGYRTMFIHRKPRETKTDEGLSLALGLRLLCDLSTGYRTMFIHRVSCYVTNYYIHGVAEVINEID